jgi:hypothetical protein
MIENVSVQRHYLQFFLDSGFTISLDVTNAIFSYQKNPRASIEDIFGDLLLTFQEHKKMRLETLKK